MFFFFKQKTAYELRISDWSSDVCSSDLLAVADRGSDGNIDSAHAAIYGGVGAGALRLRAGLGYAWLDLDTSRTIAFRGFTDSAPEGEGAAGEAAEGDRKSTRPHSSHSCAPRMPSSA